MAAYVTRTKLTDNLPESLPSDMDSAYLDTQIGDASSEVDELAGHQYTRSYKSGVQKFPDITDSPATPPSIEQCALWLALSRCYEKLEAENLGGDDEVTPRKIYYRNKAEKKLKDIADGKVDLNVTQSGIIAMKERYPDAEDDMDHVVKKTELDRLYP